MHFLDKNETNVEGCVSVMVGELRTVKDYGRGGWGKSISCIFHLFYSRLVNIQSLTVIFVCVCVFNVCVCFPTRRKMECRNSYAQNV